MKRFISSGIWIILIAGSALIASVTVLYYTPSPLLENNKRQPHLVIRERPNHGFVSNVFAIKK